MKSLFSLPSRKFRPVVTVGLFLVLGALYIAACSRHKAHLECLFPERYEGMQVEMIDYLSGDTVAVDTVRDGRVDFRLEISSSEMRDPRLMRIKIGGHTYSYYIREAGEAYVPRRLAVAEGTPYNNMFARMMVSLDSVEAYDDIHKYALYARKLYDENRDNLLGDFFATEFMRYATLEGIDSLLAEADDDLVQAKMTRNFHHQAELRKLTGPGTIIKDIHGETADGQMTTLYAMLPKGKYVLLHLGASWCASCQKDIPVLQRLYSAFHDMMGLEVIGIAVRDKREDTFRAVQDHNIEWPLLYNTGRSVYSTYGTAAIPYVILLDPDHRIIARGENLLRTRQRLERILAAAELDTVAAK